MPRNRNVLHAKLFCCCLLALVAASAHSDHDVDAHLLQRLDSRDAGLCSAIEVGTDLAKFEIPFAFWRVAMEYLGSEDVELPA